MLSRKLFLVLIAFILCFKIWGFTQTEAVQESIDLETGDPLFGAIDNVINVAQGWSKDTQQSFYFMDQGSRLMPYKWFLALEQDSNQDLFRSNENISALRFLPTKPTRLNPDALPVGFTKNVDQNGKEWVGFSCALCHTAQFSYQGTNIRIDGGPTLGDIQTLQINLLKSLQATYENAEKLERFATSVLGEPVLQEDLEALQASLAREIDPEPVGTLANYNKINYEYANQPHYGFARVDAVGAITNQVMATFNDLPENARPSNAPVSYPFLWGTHQSDVVQWPGFAPNGPFELGTLIRNAGEVIGTFGALDVPENKGLRGFLEKGVPTYRSSVRIENLGKIEDWVAKLRSPRWPEGYLPRIDRALAERGKEHYQQYCLQCHTVVAQQNQALYYPATLTPIEAVQTDPKALNNLDRKRQAGKYEGRVGLIPNFEKIPAETSAVDPLLNTALGALLQQPLATIKAAIDETSTVSKSIEATAHLQGIFSSNKEKSKAAQINSLATAKKAVEVGVYKARPLNGIWATAPYLHNGSVPNLYELLQPQAERSPVFFLGNREFDPEKVGYVTTFNKNDTSLFEFDTHLAGNSNQGHEYGVNLRDSQRKELLEYLKTL